MRKDDLDWEKLVSYAHRLVNQAAAKRLGYLLELYDLATEAVRNGLLDLVGPSYALLDPMLPAAACLAGGCALTWILQTRYKQIQATL